MPRRPGPPDMAKLHFGNKDRVLNLRLTEYLHEQIDKACAHSGMTKAPYLRGVIAAACEATLSGPSQAEQFAAFDKLQNELMNLSRKKE